MLLNLVNDMANIKAIVFDADLKFNGALMGITERDKYIKCGVSPSAVVPSGRITRTLRVIR